MKFRSLAMLGAIYAVAASFGGNVRYAQVTPPSKRKPNETPIPNGGGTRGHNQKSRSLKAAKRHRLNQVARKSRRFNLRSGRVYHV